MIGPHRTAPRRAARPVPRRVAACALGMLLATASAPAEAAEVTGTLHLQGQVLFSAPVPGITAGDLTIQVDPTATATGNGETCAILATVSDRPDGGGLYPSLGELVVALSIERGGPHDPTGGCVLVVGAYGNDGVSVSAHGIETIVASAADVGSSATLTVPDITVRQSKAIAGMDTPCYKWMKKRLLARHKCNIRLLKKGAVGASRCVDAGPEPEGCDPGRHADALLALSAGVNDQQVAPELAEAVDLEALAPQVRCQHYFGKAALKFAIKRLKLVQRHCVATRTDSETCRDAETRTAARKLDLVDRCAADQLLDVETVRPVPHAGAPCNGCIDGAGAIDRKCLKECLEIVAGELSDGVIGDLPECGNGIVQAGEACDDGNLSGGDCCDAACLVEPNCP